MTTYAPISHRRRPSRPPARPPRRGWAALAVTALSSIVVSGCTEDRGVTVVKLGHGLDVTHSVHLAMESLAEGVAQRSGGRMRIDIYPSEQLGSERQLLELLQIGSVGMTKVSAAVLENFDPTYEVLSLPYIFRDEAHQFDVLDGPIGSELLRGLEPYRLRGLAFYDAGSRSFYTKDRPVRAPADLEGLKLRVQQSPTAIELVRQFGGSPTPIAWGELYSALQQGIVDGAENNAPSFYLSGHYEIARFYSLNEHTRVPDVLLVSTSVWNDLTPDEQEWLSASVLESTERQRILWREAVDAALQAVTAAGVEVTRPDPVPFAEAVEGMYDAYREDPEVHALIERIRGS